MNYVDSIDIVIGVICLAIGYLAARVIHRQRRDSKGRWK